MTKNEKRVVGLISMAVGIFMFLRQTRIYSWGWRRADSAPAAIIVLLVLSTILYIAFKKKIFQYAIYAFLAALIVAVVLNVRMSFSGSLLTLMLMLVPIAAGAGLCISSAVDEKGEE
jgi:uncharacterized membrane protein